MKNPNRQFSLELACWLGQDFRVTKQAFDIDYTANLARIELTETERQSFDSQLVKVLEYVEKLKELDIRGVAPTSHPISLINVIRADIPTDSLPNEAAFANAPAKSKALFLVPKIVE